MSLPNCWEELRWQREEESIKCFLVLKNYTLSLILLVSLTVLQDLTWTLSISLFFSFTCLIIATMLSVWLVLVSCMDFLLYSSAEEGLEFPSFDGRDRVLNVNERNYKKALKKYDMMCLLYHEPLPSDKELQQQFHMGEMVLEVRNYWEKEATEQFRMNKNRHIAWYTFRTDHHMYYDENLFGWEEVSHGTHNMWKLAGFFLMINLKLFLRKWYPVSFFFNLSDPWNMHKYPLVGNH